MSRRHQRPGPEQLELFEAWREETRRAAWRAVRDADAIHDLAVAVRALNGWTCTERTAESIVSKWLSPDPRRPLPLYALPVIAALTGEDLGIVSAVVAAQQEHRRRMAKVEPRGQGDRKRA